MLTLPTLLALTLLAPAPPQSPATEATSALAEAAHALGEGEYPAAQAAAGRVGNAALPEQQEKARLIRGVAARGLGDFAGAVQALDFPASHLGVLEPYHQLALGDALFYAGDPKRAVDAFTRARDGAKLDALAGRASGRLGDALLALGQPCAAGPAYKAKLAVEETPERLDALARAMRLCGDTKGARDVEHRLWVAYADHPAAEALEPEFAKAAKPEERLQRAQRLMQHVGPSAGLGEAVKGLALKPRPELRARLMLLQARALIELKQRTQANALLQQAAKAAPASDAASEALVMLARAAWRRGDLKQADALFSQVAKRRDRFGDDAAFLDAFMGFDKGDYKDASAHFEDYLSKRPRSHKADEAAWFTAYAALRAGDKARARDGFERLAKKFPGSPLLPQALYWQAKTSDPKLAGDLYRSCIRAAPLSFYAGLARARLQELKLPPEPALPGATVPPPPKTALPPQAELARALGEVGLWAERGEALDAAIRVSRDPDAAANLSALCASLGEWGRAYAIANGRLWHKALEEKNPSALALLFPPAYADVVRPSAQAWGLDPAFAWAIMRRESAFDPAVESPARAIGLMQMLAPTARKIAGLLGEKELPSATDLHKPETEIPLAVWYLAELAGRFGHAGLTAAAYNAGPKNVSAWLAQNGNLPFDEFVEAIPFRETRLYVKNVVGDYLAYRALYGEAAAPLPLGTSLPPPRAGAEF